MDCPMTVAVDVHNHFLPESWPDLAERFGEPNWPWMKHLGCGHAMLMVGDEPFRPVHSATWDVSKRLEEMDRDGIDHQIMSVTPVLFAYLRKPEHALDCAHLFNDMALEMCARSGGRIHAVAQVPLQDVDASCREVERAMASGHIGVEIGNHVGAKDFDDEGIITFLHHCADIGCPILEHPWDMMARERMNRYMMQWLVAMPAETHLAMLYLILSGALERLPTSLRICFAHGGGNFAFTLGRVENAWRNRDIVRKDCPNPPSSYVKRFWCDSAVFDERALRYLVSVMGEDRVMFGTDYPYPLGEQQMGALVRGAATLSSREKALIMGENAAGFFNRKFDRRT
jgi:aminocarboxymuconate-semialdehyde decarboxylase